MTDTTRRSAEADRSDASLEASSKRRPPRDLIRLAERKRLRQALAALPVQADPCEVPGCDTGKTTEDCCYEHSLESGFIGNALPNDGIIDWTAIDATVRNLRDVRLTCIEKDIALAMMVNNGMSPTEAADRAQVNHSVFRYGGRRAKSVERILEALRSC